MWTYEPESLKQKLREQRAAKRNEWSAEFEEAYEFFKLCLITKLDPFYLEGTNELQRSALIEAFNDIQREGNSGS